MLIWTFIGHFLPKEHCPKEFCQIHSEWRYHVSQGSKPFSSNISCFGENHSVALGLRLLSSPAIPSPASSSSVCQAAHLLEKVGWPSVQLLYLASKPPLGCGHTLNSRPWTLNTDLHRLFRRMPLVTWLLILSQSSFSFGRPGFVFFVVFCLTSSNPTC